MGGPRVLPDREHSDPLTPTWAHQTARPADSPVRVRGGHEAGPQPQSARWNTDCEGCDTRCTTPDWQAPEFEPRAGTDTITAREEGEPA